MPVTEIEYQRLFLHQFFYHMSPSWTNDLTIPTNTDTDSELTYCEYILKFMHV